MKRTGLITCLALVAAGAAHTQSFSQGRVTSLGGGQFWIETPDNPGPTVGAFLTPPENVFDIDGRHGSYRVRFRGGEAAIPTVANWVPELCAPLGMDLSNLTYRSRGRILIADVTCGTNR